MFQNPAGMRPQGLRKWLRAGAASGTACIVLCGSLPSASAATFQITCEQETVGVPEWISPLVITYTGEASGTLTLSSEHLNLSLPGTYRIRPEDGAKVIDGFADTEATMPDLAQLDACTAARVPADLKGDADAYNITSMSCLGSTPPSAGPVPIRASVRVGVLPTKEAIVEIKRTYQAASAGPGGAMYIETYPKNCSLDAGR